MKSLLVALLATSLVFAATPKAYVGVVSFGAGFGYHHWNRQTEGTGTSWLGFGAQFLEGTWFLNQRLGLGLRAAEGGGSPVIGDTAGPYTIMEAWPMLTASCVLNQDKRGFGYLVLGLMPWLPAGSTDSSGIRSFSSAVTLDYGYVPFPPWPLEGRLRIATDVFNWSTREFAWQASAGIRAGLGWWFMRREGPQRI
jgi:hypothetical protein